MKKMMIMLAIALMSAATMNAQSRSELIKKQKQFQKEMRDLTVVKPTKEAKKQAKAYRKEGWQEVPGEHTIEVQITQGYNYQDEPMTDRNGEPVNRYIIQPGIATAGTYGLASRSATTNAQVELASAIETKLYGAWSRKGDNMQESMTKSFSNDKFHERMKGIIDQSLTNTKTILKMYRRLPNDQVEVSVRVAFDKQELLESVKKAIKRDLESEGDELEPLVEDVICKDF
ncbi:MAG: hypothetical protein IJS48_03560 [Prevotella sp.]|nr:hypothetical protein [Prevotella sp.]